MSISRKTYWTTAAGETILIEKMEDDHLINTYLYLGRRILTIYKDMAGFESKEDKQSILMIDILNSKLKQAKNSMKYIFKEVKKRRLDKKL